MAPITFDDLFSESAGDVQEGLPPAGKGVRLKMGQAVAARRLLPGKNDTFRIIGDQGTPTLQGLFLSSLPEREYSS